jgi:hypothetical protein
LRGVLEYLRPHPHRGDVIAAGAVPLALAAIVIELRMTQWSLGPRFAVVALISVLLLTMAWLAPLEFETPRTYHSILLVTGLVPLIVALQLLAEILGAHRPPGPGGACWTFGITAVAAVLLARRANSAVCTLIAALAAAIAVEAFVSWVFRPRGEGTFRAMLVVLSLVFAAGAVRLRDARRRHAVALVDAGGVVVLVLALTLVSVSLAVTALNLSRVGSFFGEGPTAGFGWELYLLAAGFGLVAYAAVDREPGPGYLGVAVLAAFAFLAGRQAAGRGSLVGWPLFLLVIGAAGVAIGLRPRKPLPPPPGEQEAAPTVPFRIEDQR